MKSQLIFSLLLTASSSAWAATTRPPAGLPNADDIAEAASTVSALLGVIDELVSKTDGNDGNLENDRLAREILLRMSADTESIVDELDVLDKLVAGKKYPEATKKQKTICSGLNKLKSDNSNARLGAGLPDEGNISEGDPLFDDIDSDVKDTRKVLKCK
ncbi:MAG TPA: hypothetical protein VE954_06515 [Oligoflexus sp.]|uniref:hypothetical protein n=1 Tax=Oligoflexus sp. TaxID=1971216 RepID=UPI002D620216|nr:hypothetical protein [Oligoflexus sp.]HYX32749.1 hypothetical protein [Oligoflexus sp.]